MSAPVFNHFGVPCPGPIENSNFLEGGKVHYTDPADHPYNIEFLYFESDSPMHQQLQNTPHVAFMVENLEEALEGQEVIIPPMDINENLKIAFIMDGPAVIELMQST
jgi:hypothetical protein